MTLIELRAALQGANITRLSHATGIDVQTLRRIKNGRTRDILLSTAETLSAHLNQTTEKKNAAARR